MYQLSVCCFHPCVEAPGDQPGVGKAYSTQKGTSTLYIKGEPNMIGYRLGGIVPRVGNDELIPVRLERIPKGYLPRCKPTFTGFHFDIQPRCWAREEDIPDTGKNAHSLELCSCPDVSMPPVRAMVYGGKLRVFCRHQAYPSYKRYLLFIFKMLQVKSSTS